MKLADGVEFVMGMRVYDRNLKGVITSMWAVNAHLFDNKYWRSRLRELYSTKESATRGLIARIDASIKTHHKEIKRLETAKAKYEISIS